MAAQPFADGQVTASASTREASLVQISRASAKPNAVNSAR